MTILYLDNLFGLKIQQVREVSVPLWEALLQMYSFARVLELGTGNGVFSFYLYLASKVKGAQFVTYDVKQVENPFTKMFPEFRERRVEGNIFELVQEISKRVSSSGRTVLFIDAAKSKAFRTFVPKLKRGDIVVVHDWETEIGWSDVKATAVPLTPILQDYCKVENVKREMQCFIRG